MWSNNIYWFYTQNKEKDQVNKTLSFDVVEKGATYTIVFQLL